MLNVHILKKNHRVDIFSTKRFKTKLLFPTKPICELILNISFCIEILTLIYIFFLKDNEHVRSELETCRVRCLNLQIFSFLDLQNSIANKARKIKLSIIFFLMLLSC